MRKPNTYELRVSFSGSKKFKVVAPTEERAVEILEDRIRLEQVDLLDEGVKDWEIDEAEIVDDVEF